jgi:hypothetical protein
MHALWLTSTPISQALTRTLVFQCHTPFKGTKFTGVLHFKRHRESERYYSVSSFTAATSVTQETNLSLCLGTIVFSWVWRSQYSSTLVSATPLPSFYIVVFQESPTTQDSRTAEGGGGRET